MVLNNLNKLEQLKQQPKLLECWAVLFAPRCAGGSSKLGERSRRYLFHLIHENQPSLATSPLIRDRPLPKITRYLLSYYLHTLRLRKHSVFPMSNSNFTQ